MLKELIIRLLIDVRALIIGSVVFSLVLLYSFALLGSFGDFVEGQANKLIVVKKSFYSFKKKFSKFKKLPENIMTAGEELSFEYTIDQNLTTYVKKILKRYRSDYSSVVVIDNNTGDILAAVGYTREGNIFDRTQPFTGTHPSASLFKIITASDLLQNTSVDSDTSFIYRGKGTTLYKYQLKDKKTRWTRKQTFEKAFANSNNVIFGKAAINNLSNESLFKMASSFGFNKDLMDEIDVSKSRFKLPTDDYSLAEYATGFNKQTTISPLHGALLSSVIANKGKLPHPKLVKKVLAEDGSQLWENSSEVTTVLDEKTAGELQEMMELTVNKGTARGSFRKLSRSVRKKLTIGGKTGSITGGIPYGKRDWFTAFAIPHTELEKDAGISICVMNINVKKWYVRSAYLAKNIIEYYFKNIATQKTVL